MKYLWILIVFSLAGNIAKTDKAEDIVISDKSYEFSLRRIPLSQKVELHSLKSAAGLPKDLMLKLNFADHTQMELRLISAYDFHTQPNPIYEGYLGPSTSPLIGIQLSFKNKYGMFHDLRWRLKGAAGPRGFY